MRANSACLVQIEDVKNLGRLGLVRSVLSTINLENVRMNISISLDLGRLNGRGARRLGSRAEASRHLAGRCSSPHSGHAGIAATRESGIRFGRPPVNPDTIAEKLAIVADARSRGRTATEAAALVGWSRATLYRHQTGSTTRTPAL